jgi:hypothetical protein
MGSVLTKYHRAINKDGTSHYDFKVPTLTIGGTKDGLMRVSRDSESFCHSHVSIEAAQKDLFSVMVLEGVSHAHLCLVNLQALLLTVT